MVDNLKSAVAKKKIFPVEAEETATPEKVSECKQLDSIKSEILQRDDIEIGMLIEANCMKALESLKIIPSKNDGLSALVIKHATSQNQPKPPTTSQNQRKPAQIPKTS